MKCGVGVVGEAEARVEEALEVGGVARGPPDAFAESDAGERIQRAASVPVLIAAAVGATPRGCVHERCHRIVDGAAVGDVGAQQIQAFLGEHAQQTEGGVEGLQVHMVLGDAGFCQGLLGWPRPLPVPTGFERQLVEYGREPRDRPNCAIRSMRCSRRCSTAGVACGSGTGNRIRASCTARRRPPARPGRPTAHLPGASSSARRRES